MMEMLGHKEGCLYNPDKPGCAHRVPIDCTTREDFEKAVKLLRDDKKSLETQLVSLKAKLYDLEHEGDF
jgi:hypothetical protein